MRQEPKKKVTAASVKKAAATVLSKEPEVAPAKQPVPAKAEPKTRA